MSCRAQPVSSKLCAATWQAKDAERHRSRLDSSQIAPSVDASPPRLVSLNRSKRARALDQAGLRIDRENAILLRKMSELVATHTLDVVAPQSGPRSLNESARRLELQRIDRDNAAILRRINQRRPVYQRAEWNKHQERHDAYLDNMRERTMPTDTAAAATLIPLPRFLRHHHQGAADATQRKPHAYIDGNYSKSFSRTGTQQGQVAASDSLSYSSGSQSARLPSAGGGGTLYTLYQPPQPHRTGVSKQTTARTHQLQPMPPATARQAQANQRNGHSPRAGPAAQAHANQQQQQHGSSKQQQQQQSLQQQQPPLPAPITQIAKSFADQLVNIDVHEIGHSAAVAASNVDAAASAPAESSPTSTDAISAPPSFLLSGLAIDAATHSLLFRPAAAAHADSGVQVPFCTIRALVEVQQAGEEIMLAPAMRVQLTQLLAGRLQTDEQGRLRFLIGALSDGVTADAESQQHDSTSASTADANSSTCTASSADTPAVAAADRQQDGATAESSSAAAAAAAAPSPSAPLAVAYTDSIGIQYYFDDATQQYQPFPESATAATL